VVRLTATTKGLIVLIRHAENPHVGVRDANEGGQGPPQSLNRTVEGALVIKTALVSFELKLSNVDRSPHKVLAIKASDFAQDHTCASVRSTDLDITQRVISTKEPRLLRTGFPV